MTQTAVCNVQMDASLQPTGIADDAFCQYLFSHNAKTRQGE